MSLFQTVSRTLGNMPQQQQVKTATKTATTRKRQANPTKKSSSASPPRKRQRQMKLSSSSSSSSATKTKTTTIQQKVPIPPKELLMSKNLYLKAALEEGRVRDAWAIRHYAFGKYEDWYTYCLPSILRDGVETNTLTRTRWIDQTLKEFAALSVTSKDAPSFCYPTAGDTMELKAKSTRSFFDRLVRLDPNRISHNPSASFVEHSRFTEIYVRKLVETKRLYFNTGGTEDNTIATAQAQTSSAPTTTITTTELNRDALPLVVIVGSPGNGRRCLAQRCFELADYSYRVYSAYNNDIDEIRHVADRFLGFPSNNGGTTTTSNKKGPSVYPSTSSSFKNNRQSKNAIDLSASENNKPCGYIFENVDLWPAHILSKFLTQFLKATLRGSMIRCGTWGRRKDGTRNPYLPKPAQQQQEQQRTPFSTFNLVGRIPLIFTISKGYRCDAMEDWTKSDGVWRVLLQSVTCRDMQNLLVEFTRRYSVTCDELLLKFNIQQLINAIFEKYSADISSLPSSRSSFVLPVVEKNWKHALFQWAICNDSSLFAIEERRLLALKLLPHVSSTIQETYKDSISALLVASSSSSHRVNREEEEHGLSYCCWSKEQFFEDLWLRSDHKVGIAFRHMAWICSTHRALPYIPHYQHQQQQQLDSINKHGHEIPSAYQWTLGLLLGRPLEQFMLLSKTLSNAETSLTLAFMYRSGIDWIFPQCSFLTTTRHEASSSSSPVGTFLVLYGKLLDVLKCHTVSSNQSGLDMQLVGNVRSMATDRLELVLRNGLGKELHPDRGHILKQTNPKATWPKRATDITFEKAFARNPNLAVARVEARCPNQISKQAAIDLLLYGTSHKFRWQQQLDSHAFISPEITYQSRKKKK